MGKHKHKPYYAQLECYKMFILQTVYDTVTEQKCETKARVQQKLINGIVCKKKSTNHNAFDLFIEFYEKN